MLKNINQFNQTSKVDLENAYQSYITYFNLRRLRIACFFGIVLFPAGYIFDYFIYPAQCFSFLLIRLAFTTIYIVTYILTFSEFVKKYLSFTVVILAELMALPIVILVLMTGGHASGYYAGLSLIIFGMGVLFTLTMLEASIICGLVYATYVFPILLFDKIEHLPIFLNNNYFLLFIIFIALVSNYFGYKLRFNDFESRYRLKDYVKELKKAYNELKTTQAQLLHSAKLASVGQLAAGVAHELNNALDIAVLGNLCLKKTLTKTNDKPELTPTMQEIKSSIALLNDGINRAHQVVKNLLTFSKKNAEGFKYQRVHEGIEASLKILNNELKNRITIHKDYCEDLEIFCDLSQLNQVFLNILKNASDAIRDKGNIWIKTYTRDNYFCVSIKDDGPGIPEEYRNKIFEPFFTTKDVGKGTGLGLSVSYNIVKAHKGFIESTTRKNEGTEFIITLPIAHSIEEKTANENTG